MASERLITDCRMFKQMVAINDFEKRAPGFLKEKVSEMHEILL